MTHFEFEWDGHHFWVEPTDTPHVYEVYCVGKIKRNWRTFWIRMTKPCSVTPVGTTASSIDWLGTFAQRHVEES